MTLPGWHSPSGVWRCDTVQWSEHQGVTVLKLFMASVKSDGRSDRVSLSSIKSVRNCERAAKSNNNLPAVWNPVEPDEMYISETKRPLAHFSEPIYKLFKALKEFGYCGDSTMVWLSMPVLVEMLMDGGGASFLWKIAGFDCHRKWLELSAGLLKQHPVLMAQKRP